MAEARENLREKERVSLGGNVTKSGVWQFFLKSWQPVPTLLSTLLIFGLIGLAFIIFGIILHVINNNISEVSTGSYNVECGTKTNCVMTLNIPTDMQPPIYVFYEIHNFYQNHRRYIKSKDNSQLAGTVIENSTAITSCDPIYMNIHLGRGSNLKSWDNSTVLPDYGVANPCGLIARSVFNDTYNLTDAAGNYINIDESGISWPQDKGTKFQRAPNSNQIQWIDPLNEHFIVWMRTAGLPNFRKLWGRINKTLTAGNYALLINNNYDVAGFQGAKMFVLSTSGPFGGKNSFLEISYFVVGGVCLLIALLFFIRNRMTGGRFGNIERKAD